MSDQNLRGAPIKDRFIAKVEVEEATGCWLWKSGMFIGGYGMFQMGRATKAHRASWMIYRGDIPNGLCVLHKCDVRRCVNPDHLFLGTKAENNHDRDNKGRSTAKLSHAQVTVIREAKGRESQSTLAKRFSVDRSTISLIQSGKRGVARERAALQSARRK